MKPRRILRNAVVALALIVAALVASLALPVRSWRTGEQPVAPLAFLPDDSLPPPATRVWIDTDAACGGGDRGTDPDDCLAILLLARSSGIEIAGISTVFGNAPLDTTDRITRELVALVALSGGAVIPVHRGFAGAEQQARTTITPAQLALREALRNGPLTIVALGPLSNIEAALRDAPESRANVSRLVAVMGRRIGHLFHPGEGAGGGMLFGHGPVFRDFNFGMDEEAATRVLAMRLPVTLIPYEAARSIEITAADLDTMASRGAAEAWVAQRSRGWLGYWREEIGRGGFYPFDLLAAAYLVDPRAFRCARVIAAVAKDNTLFIPFWSPTALLVGQDSAHIVRPRAVAVARYCPEVDVAAGTALGRWTGAADASRR